MFYRIFLISMISMIAQTVWAKDLFPSGSNIITTVGKGEVEVSYTEAILHVAINRDGSNPQMLQTEVNQTANKLLQETKKASPVSIETIGSSISPRLNYDSKFPRITGYTANYTLKIITKADQVGKFIDLVVKNGATTVSDPQFITNKKDLDVARSAAIKIATQDAQEQTKVALSSLGLKSRNVYQIKILGDDEYGNSLRRQYITAFSSKMPQKSDTPVEIGKQIVVVKVELSTRY